MRNNIDLNTDLQCGFVLLCLFLTAKQAMTCSNAAHLNRGMRKCVRLFDQEDATELSDKVGLVKLVLAVTGQINTLHSATEFSNLWECEAICPAALKDYVPAHSQTIT